MWKPWDRFFKKIDPAEPNPILERDPMFREYIQRTLPAQFPVGGAVEVITNPLYSTNVYVSNTTTELRFFSDGIAQGDSWTNIYIPGCMPNPCAFAVEAIRLFGIVEPLRLGTFLLEIGNKHYGKWPAWSLSLREKNVSMIPLFIGPMVHFRATIRWPQAYTLPPGLGGEPREKQLVQVLMRGSYYRPVQ
jgi:hypothetical protein